MTRRPRTAISVLIAVWFTFVWVLVVYLDEVRAASGTSLVWYLIPFLIRVVLLALCCRLTVTLWRRHIATPVLDRIEDEDERPFHPAFRRPEEATRDLALPRDPASYGFGRYGSVPGTSGPHAPEGSQSGAAADGSSAEPPRRTF